MGFDIRLEDERGERLDNVGDPTNILQRLLPSVNDHSFVCLTFIDPYGDTVFNQLQMETCLVELERIAAKATTDQERDLLDGVKRLMDRCRSEQHVYLKFYGD